MPIAHTALDARWNRVAASKVGGRAATFATALQASDERSRIEAVNAYVNARVAFTSDSRLFGVDDRWSSANDTLARGRGDCEDYALAKLAMLRRAGIADRNLYFVVLKDVARRADHAVLVVHSEGRFLVLDNGTDRLRDSSDLVDYKPVLTFTASQRFTHGYRRSFASPVVLASNIAVDRRWDRLGMPSSPFAAR
jgi:predicted transglutaminase-like cysteine proteinase